MPSSAFGYCLRSRGGRGRWGHSSTSATRRGAEHNKTQRNAADSDRRFCLLLLISSSGAAAPSAGSLLMFSLRSILNSVRSSRQPSETARPATLPFFSAARRAERHAARRPSPARMSLQKALASALQGPWAVLLCVREPRWERGGKARRG